MNKKKITTSLGLIYNRGVEFVHIYDNLNAGIKLK